MAENALESGTHCIFEGDMLLPEHLADLAEVWGEQVQGCFLGYRHIEPAKKLAEVREFAGLPNDWLTEHDDEYVLGELRFGVRFSEELAAECQSRGIRYFDGSTDFDRMVSEALDFLEGRFDGS